MCTEPIREQYPALESFRVELTAKVRQEGAQSFASDVLKAVSALSQTHIPSGLRNWRHEVGDKSTYIGVLKLYLCLIFQSYQQPRICSQEILTNSVALVRERTIPTERPPLISEVSTNFCG
jgi:hypothetical protein